MEIELKYTIENPETIEELWEDVEIKEMEEKGSRILGEMKSVYYDTKDMDLLSRDIAFRIREEGNRVTATLKWNGKTDGALHIREELNVNLGEGLCPCTPDPGVFSQSEMGKELLALIEDRPLVGFITVRVSRRRVRVDTNQAILEIALDTGAVETEKGHCRICEAEMELYSGKQEELTRLGDHLSEKYRMVPETKSKFARGLALLGLSSINHFEGEE